MNRFFIDSIAGPIIFSCVRWGEALQAYIKASIIVATRVESGMSLIVQGYAKNLSHFVVCSLTQLLVDPHYRTVLGFVSLIEKDWFALCYPFSGTPLNLSTFPLR